MISIMLSTLQIIYICGNFDQVRVQNAIGDIYEIVQRMLGKSEENGLRYAIMQMSGQASFHLFQERVKLQFLISMNLFKDHTLV